jgi:hypothetical protein
MSIMASNDKLSSVHGLEVGCLVHILYEGDGVI